MKKQQQIEIGLILYPQVQQAAVLGLTDLFQIANDIAQKQSITLPLLKTTHWALEGATNQIVCVYDSDALLKAKPSVLIAPPTLASPTELESISPFKDFLLAHHKQGVILSSVCAGAFVLAETGLLANRTVTTHWTYTDCLKTSFPHIKTDPDRLIIEDGDLITAGGIMAWTDLGLTLVERFLGASVMIKTAQMLLIDPPGREQSYYRAFVPNFNHQDNAILKLQHALQASAEKHFTLAQLASLAQLEPRTLLRRFQKATGMTTTEYIQRLKVNKAQELLQFSRLPVETVAWEVGYSDVSAFRKVFSRLVGLNPSDYRQRFSSNEKN